MTLKVIAILGPDRSGSTLLDTILGGVPGVFSGGEIRYFWERGILERRLCGCSNTLDECEVWSQVLARVPSSEDDATRINDMLELLRTRHAFTPLLPVFSDRYDASLRPLISPVQELFRAIGEVTGDDVIIDSSKRPNWAYLLQMIPDLDVRFVHLVRDPRAVAHSRNRFKQQLDSGEVRGMKEHPPALTAVFWDVWNAATSMLFSDSPHYLKVRYEDLIASPEKTVRRILDLAGLDSVTHPGLVGSNVELVPNHTVSGNPGRFKTGPIELKLDEAWRRDQGSFDRTVVTALSAPWLSKYGYTIPVDE